MSGRNPRQDGLDEYVKLFFKGVALFFLILFALMALGLICKLVGS